MKANRYSIQCDDESCKSNKPDKSLDHGKVKIIGIRRCARESRGLWFDYDGKCVLKNRPVRRTK